MCIPADWGAGVYACLYSVQRWHPHTQTTSARWTGPVVLKNTVGHPFWVLATGRPSSSHLRGGGGCSLLTLLAPGLLPLRGLRLLGGLLGRLLHGLGLGSGLLGRHCGGGKVAVWTKAGAMVPHTFWKVADTGWSLLHKSNVPMGDVYGCGHPCCVPPGQPIRSI